MGVARFTHILELRVRYSETDQMGTFYNSRALEWFEVARTELLRAAGIAYAEMEHRGVLLPLVEAHVRFEGRARYDDLLHIEASAAMSGKASVRFDYRIIHKSSGVPVTTGHTIHAVTNADARPIRAPQWLIEALAPSSGGSAP